MVEWEAVGAIIVFTVLLYVITLYLRSVEPPYFKPVYSLQRCYVGEVNREEFISSVISGCAGNYTLLEPVSYYDIEESANYAGLTSSFNKECLAFTDIVVSKPILNGRVEVIKFNEQIKVC